MAGRDFFLIQFIRSQGLLFDEAISYILLSKNFLLVSFKVDLYAFQLGRSSYALYLLRPSVQSWFYHALECFVMRLVLECWDHAFLKISARHRTTIWSSSLLLMHNMSSCSTPLISALMKAFSLLLSFLIDQMLMLMFVSLIPISIERGTWSEGFRNSGYNVRGTLGEAPSHTAVK